MEIIEPVQRSLTWVQTGSTSSPGPCLEKCFKLKTCTLRSFWCVNRLRCKWIKSTRAMPWFKALEKDVKTLCTSNAAKHTLKLDPPETAAHYKQAEAISSKGCQHLIWFGANPQKCLGTTMIVVNLKTSRQHYQLQWWFPPNDPARCERKESVILSMVNGCGTIVTKRKLGPDII